MARPAAAAAGRRLVGRADGGIPDRALDGALVLAWEVLDVVPCPVVEMGAGRHRPHVVLVEPGTGRERLGGAAGRRRPGLVPRWWPMDRLEEGDRVEVGRPRDALVAGAREAARGGSRGGSLLAVDYAHTLRDRPATAP